eukprot:TRINITY_DN36602_c0_g1_i1.p1 TRINITY_DN36602_c0_g1~~TRINITY_DN36602_c0_g1_i1.p1  ORF type:complete len:159 (-),score=21.33 TRINITY_DN36602_c0_g1_i1:98-574(-)
MKVYCATALVLLLAVLPRSEAGFRCTFGDWMCTAGCVMLGQTSGICDEDWNCHCSERSITLRDFNALLPSRCNLGEEFCKGTCQAIGREGGVCDRYGCTCSDNYLSPTEFLLCAAESTCRTHCQAQGSATGVCLGWSCQCKSSDAEASNALSDLMRSG